MGRSIVDNQRSESVRKRVYLPDVDEFRSSSGPLSEVVLESLDPVSSLQAKPLKEGYVADITREGGVSPSCVILGLLYVHRLTETNPRFLRSISSKDLFLTAMVVASKYLNDEGESEALTNSEWAEVGCKARPVLDLLERQFLAAIDWRLYVSLEEYYSFVTGIEGRIALNQFASRGWLSYTDLVTIWDTMDTQTALLTATKQVAKVTCGSAAVYLVLLSTLFTASHTLNSWSPSPSSPSSFPLSSPPTPETANSTSADIASLMMQDPSNVVPPELPLETYGKSPPDLTRILHNTHLEHGRLKLINSRNPQMPCSPSVSIARPALFSPSLHTSAIRCVHCVCNTWPGMDFNQGLDFNEREFDHRVCGEQTGSLRGGAQGSDHTGGYNNSRPHCRRSSEAIAADEKVAFPYPNLRGVDLHTSWEHLELRREAKATKHTFKPPHCTLGLLHHTTSEHSGIILADNRSETLLSTVYQYFGGLHDWAVSTILQVVLPPDMLGQTAHEYNVSLDSTATNDHRWLAVDDRSVDRRRLVRDLIAQTQTYGEVVTLGVDQQLLLPVLDQGRLWL